MAQALSSLRIGIIIALALLSAGLLAVRGVQPAAATATFAVDSTADGTDANAGDGDCDDGSGNCTLRAAIEEANALAGVDTIEFNIGSGLVTIEPATHLPKITEGVIIDGTTQPGFVGEPIVELDGTDTTAYALTLCPGVNSFVYALYFDAPATTASTVRGLIIDNYPAACTGAAGIYVNTGTGHVIQGNYFGVRPDGLTAGDMSIGIAVVNFTSVGTIIGGDTAAERNVFGGGTFGIDLTGSQQALITGNYVGVGKDGATPVGLEGGIGITGGAGNVIGGPGPGEGNVIAATTNPALYGVVVALASSADNVIEGNLFGTDASGALDRGNAGNGVNVAGGDGIRVRGNVISGSGSNGILVTTALTTNTIIEGNKIGTDAAGTAAIPNDEHGILVDGGALQTRIGGHAGGEGNLISGNVETGIHLGAGALNSLVEGNLIGTDASGTAPLPNGTSGIALEGSFNQIGGPGTGQRNVIAANVTGIKIGTGAGINTVVGNYIGVDITGAADLGNTGDGIGITDADGQIIGGATAASANVISGNGGAGIVVEMSDDTAVRGNYIGTNAAGTAAIANDGGGVSIVSSSTNTVLGGSPEGYRNVISGNAAHGVEIDAASGNTVAGNYIGTTANGAAAVPNAGFGVRVQGSATNNTIGGLAGNRIAHNLGPGVSVDGAGTTGNSIRSNGIYANTGAAISLTSGGNAALAAPVITSTSDGQIVGTSCALCQIDIFSDEGSDARTFEGSAVADDNGDTTGDWTYSGPFGGPRIIATATDAAGNTSSLSVAVGLVINGVAGSAGVPGFNNDVSVSGAAALLDDPHGIFRDADGVIYFADTQNNRIRTIDTDAPRTVSTFAGSGAFGTGVACDAFAGDGGPALSATLCHPRDVFVSDGAVFIADSENCVIRKVDQAGLISRIAGSAAGACGDGGDGGAATSALLNEPRGVAVDADGNVYIADTLNHRVRKVSAATGVITTIAGGNGAGFDGDLGAAAAARLHTPHDVYIALGTHLIIADTGNNRVRMVHLSSGRIYTLAGTGVAAVSPPLPAAYDGDAGLAFHAKLNQPEAVAVEPDGDVLVGDTGNHKVRHITFNGLHTLSQHIITTIAGTGIAGPTVDGVPATMTDLNRPTGVSVGVPGAGGASQFAVAQEGPLAGGGPGEAVVLRMAGRGNAADGTGGDTIAEVDSGTGLIKTNATSLTLCTQGVAAIGDWVFIGLLPLGMVAARKRGRWLFSLLVAVFRRPASQPV